MIRTLLFLCLCAIIEKSLGEVPEHVQYLVNYGYLETPEEGGPPDSFSSDEIDSALKIAQSFSGIPATGKLDNQTKKMLSSPRCGIPDTGSRLKRFGTASKWNKRDITYGFLNHSPKLRANQTENTIRKALQIWAKPSGLRFFPVDAKIADMKIGFFRRKHVDDFPFDGFGGVLAHAYFPGSGIGGDVHFDDDENWTLDNYEEEDALSLLSTAIHEIGHALGLQHSNVYGATMRPSYTGQHNLGDDDILGIQALYNYA